jgi:hypothetical protein
MSYLYSEEELALPEYSGKGTVRPTYVTFSSEAVPADGTDAAKWLQRKLFDGWEVISIDGGIGYFQKKEFRLYEVIGDELIRIKPGQYS